MRKISIFIISCICLFAFVFGVGNIKNNGAIASDTSVKGAFVMQYGASVRVKDSDGENNGIRFTAEMVEDYYNATRLLKDVSYGTFIMPATYQTVYGELNEENLLSVYDWISLDGKLEYGDEGRVQIANVEYSELVKDNESDGVYYLCGSLVNMKESNLDEEFVGRAYVKYKVGESYKYDVAEWASENPLNNTRSVTFVAKSALDDEESTLSSRGEEFLQTNYLDKASALFTEISTVEEFLAMEGYGRYKLANDIDFGGTVYKSKSGTGMLPNATTFSGVLDGCGYSIKNITLGSQDNQSIFGVLTGVIKNISFENIVFNGWNSSGVYKTSRSSPIWQIVDGGVVKNSTFDVVFNAVGGAYTNDESPNGLSIWNSKVNAGICAGFFAGEINGVEVYIQTPTNNSEVDGVTAISAICNGANYSKFVKNAIISDVTVYAKSSSIDPFPIYAYNEGTPKTSNLKIIAEGESEIETDYKIVIGENESDEVKYAGEELQLFLSEATGKELEIITSYNADAIYGGENKFIVLGSIAGKNGYDGLTTDTGYKMVKDGNTVYLYGRTSLATLSAVYAFMKEYIGLEFYSPTVYDINQIDELILDDEWEDVTFNPSIDYLWACDGSLTKGTREQNIKNCARMGFVYDRTVTNFNWHNLLNIISNEKYGHNSSWFVTDSDSNGNFTTLNFRDEMVRNQIAVAMARELSLKVRETSKEVVFFGVSLPDRNGSVMNTENYVLFMNEVARILDTNYHFNRDIKLMLLAYHETMNAPTTAGLSLYQSAEGDIKLGVMFASTSKNIYRNLEHDINATYKTEFDKWQSLGGETYYWKYSTYTDSYFIPIDTVTNTKADYTYLASKGLKVMYDMGQHDTPVGTDWQALKTYIKGQLAKNVDLELSTLIANFCDGYYGEGSSYMQALINAEIAWYPTIAQRTKEVNGVEKSGIMSGAVWVEYKAYWDDTEYSSIFSRYDNSMLVKWYKNVTNALNAVSDTEIKNRIMVEGLALRYLSLKSFGKALVSGDTYAVLIEEASAFGITKFGEGDDIANMG